MRALAKKHVIVLDDQAVSRLNLLKKIPAKKNAVVVLSAHGSEKNTLSYAKNNFGYCYDLTCKYIHENIKIINELLDKKNIIIFLGKKNHPETKAILSYSPKIIYIESIKDLSKIKFGATKKYCLLNQTTMPQYAISDSLKDIKYPNLH
jgi:4-hydroxy-3-methylbut-2-enyl diphosphate reductase